MAAEHAVRTGVTLVKWGLRSSIGVALLNFGYALLRRRHDYLSPAISHASREPTKGIPEYLAIFVFASRVFRANMVRKMFITLLLVVHLHFIE